jgi:LysR substrate binding domain
MPGLEVVVATGNTPDVLKRVEAGEIDAALLTLGGRVPRTLLARRLFADPLLALVPAALAPGALALGPAEVTGFPLILYERGASTRDIVDRWFHRAGIAPRPVMELGSVEAIKVLVGSGFGASLLPRLALGQAVPGTVVAGLKPRLARDIAIVLRRGKVLERGLQLLVEELQKVRGVRSRRAAGIGATAGRTVKGIRSQFWRPHSENAGSRRRGGTIARTWRGGAEARKQEAGPVHFRESVLPEPGASQALAARRFFASRAVRGPCFLFSCGGNVWKRSALSAAKTLLARRSRRGPRRRSSVSTRRSPIAR